MEISLQELCFLSIFVICLWITINLSEKIYYQIKRRVLAKGSVILITGSSGCLSSYMLEYLGQTSQPSQFILIDKQSPKSDALLQELHSLGHTTQFFQLDLDSTQSIQNISAQIQEKYSHIDLFVFTSKLLLNIMLYR